jgi:DsbC/DsbD-like thiol-disulfide interchange protein
MRTNYKLYLLTLLALFTLSSITASFAKPIQGDPPDIKINDYASVNKIQKGRSFQVAIVMDIPDKYHINSNRPLSKFSIPTTIKIEAPKGVRIGTVSFPPAKKRRFSFSQNELWAVYEGRVVMRFNVTVPVNYSDDKVELRAKLRYQSCSDEVCFRPDDRDLKVKVEIADKNDSIKQINTEFFSRRR